MMTLSDVGKLLWYIGQFDNRKITPEAAQAWQGALAPYVNLDDAKRAVDEHVGTSGDYLMPLHVNQAVKRYRADRIARAPYGDVPAGLDARQTNAWLTAYRSEIGDGQEPGQAQATADHALRIDRPVIEAADPEKVRQLVAKTARTLPRPPEVPNDAA